MIFGLFIKFCSPLNYITRFLRLSRWSIALDGANIDPLAKGIRLQSTYYTDKNLFNTHNLELNYIHIGKCGGTSVRRRLRKDRINNIFHQGRPNLNTSENSRYFFFLRHPITRLASAFSHCRDVALFPIDNVDPFSLNIENCPAPVRIKNKILNSNKYAYSEEFDRLLLRFPDFVALSESLSSTNPSLRQDAISLLQFPQDNIFKGIGWYLRSGRFVKKNYSKIFFVGSSEWMQQGLEILDANFSLIKSDSLPSGTIVRKSTNKMHHKDSLSLSARSRKSLFSFLQDSDMRALRILRDLSLVSQELHEYYAT